MTIVVICLVLLTAGLFAIVRWGSLDVQEPARPGADPVPVGYAVGRFVWATSLLLWTSLITGVLVAGPAGRLAMRLLAATAGSEAQGRRTEAEEIVGRISVDGTIGLFIFVGLFAGLISALAYLVLRRWLPSGRIGGLVLGVLLLVFMGTRFDPLRADNPDFDIVGPGFVSIAVYSTMAIVQGMAIVAVAGRVSRWLPLPARGLRSLLPHAVLVMLVPAFVVLMVGIPVGVLVVVLSRTKAAAALRSQPALIAGRVLVLAGVLVALPSFLSAVGDIAARGP